MWELLGLSQEMLPCNQVLKNYPSFGHHDTFLKIMFRHVVSYQIEYIYN
jgi:hypothetical protein